MKIFRHFLFLSTFGYIRKFLGCRSSLVIRLSDGCIDVRFLQSADELYLTTVGILDTLALGVKEETVGVISLKFLEISSYYSLCCGCR